MLAWLIISVCMMISKYYFSLPITFVFAALFSPHLFAANKCSQERTESTFELINAPVAEMQQSRSQSLEKCIEIRDFIARVNKARTGVQSSQASSNGVYVPKTKDDNSPWRFDMSQNGKRMTSEEFDAWMKAKGIRVATGKPGEEKPIECKPSKDVKC
ncbi:MAG: hypothetical protein ACREO2_10510 [Arenimonas sp.]